MHEIKDSRIADLLLTKGFIEECNKGDEISDWSRLKKYDNLYFPKMNLMISGKCNFELSALF